MVEDVWEKNEAELTEMTETRQAKFPAAGEACKAILQPIQGLKHESLVAMGSQTLISESAVTHCKAAEQKLIHISNMLWVQMDTKNIFRT